MTISSRAARATTAVLTALLTFAAVLSLAPESASAATQIAAVNFQPAGERVPDGYTADVGAPYSAEAGSGWVAYDGSGAPVDMRHGATDRDATGWPKRDTFIHMQPWKATWGRWVMDVPNARYEVTVVVGDTGEDGGLHWLNVEGVTAVDRWSASGPGDRTQEVTVRVDVVDGRLTLTPHYKARTKLVAVDIVRLDGAGGGGATTDDDGGGGGGASGEQRFNFQPAGAPTPSGWIADTGRSFSGNRGYGWVIFNGSGTPVDVDTSAVDRNNNNNQVLDTFIDMKEPQTQWGRWELAVPDGTYEVSVTVGDASNVAQSSHTLVVEGTTFFDRWDANWSNRFKTVTKSVDVSDGRLTFDPSYGERTKLVSVVVGGSGGGGGSTQTTTTEPQKTTYSSDGGSTYDLGGNTFGAVSGFAPGGGFPGLPLDQLEREMDEMAAAGAQWLRVPMLWSTMEPRQGQFNFSRGKKIAELARERGIELIANISYTPKWARVSGCSAGLFCEPRNVWDYARFAKELVKTMKPLGVDVFEIWNEPNMKIFWAPKPNPVKYANLVKAAYPAMKDANSNITVLAGSMAPARDLSNGNQVHPETFLTKLYNNGVKGRFDALSFHPYSWPVSPVGGQDWNAFSGVMPDLHQIMQNRGDGWKKIWATEFGFPTSGPNSVSEDFQARMIEVSTREYAKYSFSAVLVWFSYRDASYDKGHVHDNFGIVNRNWSKKKAYWEFKRVMRLQR